VWYYDFDSPQWYIQEYGPGKSNTLVRNVLDRFYEKLNVFEVHAYLVVESNAKEKNRNIGITELFPGSMKYR
jgi:hypothetical protein